jgi:hypothetical protein
MALLRKISDEDLDRRFTDVQLAFIGQYVLEWEEKAGMFGLSAGDIEDIREDNKYSHKSQKLAMLRSWKEQSGEEANLRNLVKMAENNKWKNLGKRFLLAASIEWGYLDDDGRCRNGLGSMFSY